MMVRVELEPAIKLSREIIQELQGDIKELHQGMEDSYRRLIEKLLSEGKSKEEIEADLMAIFALSKEAARGKIECYKRET